MRQGVAWSSLRVLLVGMGVVLGATAGGGQTESANGWHTFEAGWSASGERHTLAMEEGRLAVIVRLSGSLMLKAGDGLRRGFRAEAVAFDDGHGTGVGRAVWTDDRGDRIFSRLTGQPASSGRRLSGEFTGGTGRYTGISGTYAFTWDYVMPADEGRIQATAVALSGRYRRGASQ